jgi:hypothetical protein
MVYAYYRCNSGHFFEGEACPFDGWSSDGSRQLLAAVSRLRSEGKEHFTVDDLGHAGLSDEARPRCIVVEFGSSASRFEAISIDYVCADDVCASIHKAGARFK